MGRKKPEEHTGPSILARHSLIPEFMRASLGEGGRVDGRDHV